MAGGEISVMPRQYPGNMRPQVIDQGGAQQRRAILAAFAVSYVDQMLIEVDILDTQTTSFVNPQPAAINDLQYQTGRSLDLGKDVPYFIDGKHHRQCRSFSGPYRVFQIAEINIANQPKKGKQTVEGLILC